MTGSNEVRTRNAKNLAAKNENWERLHPRDQESDQFLIRVYASCLFQHQFESSHWHGYVQFIESLKKELLSKIRWLSRLKSFSSFIDNGSNSEKDWWSEKLDLLGRFHRFLGTIGTMREPPRVSGDVSDEFYMFGNSFEEEKSFLIQLGEGESRNIDH